MHPRESTYECDDEKLFDNNSDHSLTKKKLSNYHIFRVRSPVIVLEWGEKIIISKSVARSECERENEHMTQSCTRDLIKSFVVLRLLLLLLLISLLLFSPHSFCRKAKSMIFLLLTHEFEECSCLESFEGDLFRLMIVGWTTWISWQQKSFLWV